MCLFPSQSRNAPWPGCDVVPHGGKLQVPRTRLRRSPREACSQAGDADVSPAALSLPEAHTDPAQAQVDCSVSLPFLGASPAALS